MHRQHKGEGKKKKKKRRERRKRHGKEEKMWSGINQARGGSRGAQQHVLRSRRTGSARGRFLPGRVSTGKQPASWFRERHPQPLLVLIRCGVLALVASTPSFPC